MTFRIKKEDEKGFAGYFRLQKRLSDEKKIKAGKEKEFFKNPKNIKTRNEILMESPHYSFKEKDVDSDFVKRWRRINIGEE